MSRTVNALARNARNSANLESNRRKSSMNSTIRVLVSLVIFGLAGSVLAQQTLTWSGDTGNWDAATANWNGDTATFIDGNNDACIFDSSSTGAVTVAANVIPASTTVSGAGSYTFTGGPIDGGTLAKSDAGTLTLANTAGMDSNGFSSVTIDGGTIRAQRFNAGMGHLGAGTIAFTGNATLATDNLNVTDYGNGWTNPISINDGVTATLDILGNSGNHHVHLTGAVTGNGALEVKSTGGSNQWFYFDNTGNTFGGGLTLNAVGGSGISVSATDTLGSGPITMQSGAFQLYDPPNNPVSVPNAIQWNGTVSVQVSSSADGTLAGDITGAGTMHHQHANDLYLTGNNSGFSGEHYFNQGPNGFVVVASQSNLGTGNFRQDGNNPGLRITGVAPGSFSNSLSLCASAAADQNFRIEIVESAAVVAWNGGVSGGQGDFRKTGAGTLRFNGNWTASSEGDFSVEVGRLNFNDTDTSTNKMRNVFVTAGATLGGTGSMSMATGKSVAVNGTLAPGESTGVFTIDGPVSFGATGFFAVEINETNTVGTDYDRLVVGPAGSVTLASSATFAPSFGVFTTEAGDVAYILDNQGVLAVSGTFNGLLDDALVGTWNGKKWRITYNAITGSALDGGNDIALYAIPEPATALVLGLAGLAALRRRR